MRGRKSRMNIMICDDQKDELENMKQIVLEYAAVHSASTNSGEFFLVIHPFSRFRYINPTIFHCRFQHFYCLRCIYTGWVEVCPSILDKSSTLLWYSLQPLVLRRMCRYSFCGRSGCSGLIISTYSLSIHSTYLLI